NGATLDLALGFTPARGNTFTIIDNTGTAPVSGTFARLPEGGTTTVNGTTFRISYVGGTGNDVVLTVDRGVTTTTLTATPNPAARGATVTLTAAVASPAGTPDGTVEFFADGASLGTAALANGSATLSVPFPTAGTHSLTANYQGNDTFAPSTSAAVSLQV